MDYTLECAIFQYNENRRNNMSLLESLDEEASMLLESFSIMEVVMEAKNDAKTLFGKFKNFVMRIYEAFIRNITEIFRNDEKWLDQNKNLLLTADYSKMSMEMIPFKDVIASDNVLIPSLNKFRGDVLSRRMKEDLKDRQSVEKYYFNNLIDSTGDLANGAKNFFRVGNPNGPIKHVKYQGPTLKAKVSELIKFCETYKDKTVKDLESARDRAFSLIQTIESELDKRKGSGVKESFILLERYCLGEYKETVLEADVKGSEKKSNTYVYVDEKKEKPTPKIKQTPKEENKEADKTTNKEEPKEQTQDEKDKAKYVDNTSSLELKVLQNVMGVVQTILAAKLTVAEEKYRASMNALSSLARTVKKKGDKVEDSNIKTK